MVSTKKRIIRGIFIAAITVFLIGFMFHSYGPKGSTTITNSDLTTKYDWKGASIKTKGNVIPDNCATSAHDCTCNLSDKDKECTLTFSFENLDKNTKIKILRSMNMLQSLTYTKDDNCNDRKNPVYYCSVTLKRITDKTGSEDIKILLNGPKGNQNLVNLKVNIN